MYPFTTFAALQHCFTVRLHTVLDTTANRKCFYIFWLLIIQVHACGDHFFRDYGMLLGIVSSETMLLGIVSSETMLLEIVSSESMLLGIVSS